MFYLCYCYLFMHIRLCSCRLTVMGITCGAVTVNPFVAYLVFSGVRAARSFVFCVLFCRSLFVPLAFFDLRNISEILITDELILFLLIEKTLWRNIFGLIFLLNDQVKNSQHNFIISLLISKYYLTSSKYPVSLFEY
jgi:hypothetical protein